MKGHFRRCAYSETDLVEHAAIDVFKSLGYEHMDCYNETFGESGTFGRAMSEVVLIPRLKDALMRLNSGVSSEAVQAAIEKLTEDRSSLNMVTANKEVYALIRDGVKVSVKQTDGSEDIEVIKVIDFDQPENNDFFLTSQFWVMGELYKRRADLVGFVNGLPLVFIELKATHKRLEDAYRNNLQDYKDTITQLFWYNAVVVLSNGSQSRLGTVSSDWEHFNEWKKINSEDESGVVSLDTIIKGVCEKRRLLDIVENFTLFQDANQAAIKIVAKNHQYLGVNNAFEAFKKIEDNKGRLGVFWHTQGSGKSFSMIFFSQKVMRKLRGDYTFVIVTDRKELDEQIYGNFASVGAVTEKEVHAESGAHLKQLLTENHRNIFTLVQKFRTDGGEPYPVLSKRSDIIVMADEAHRTQYDEFAKNMRTALPNAAFIAFTGTPLIVGEEMTRKTFGDYVSVYDFKQSVDDGATVTLFYENRIPELQLKNQDLNEDMERLIEDAILDEKQEDKLEREFAREYHLITRDDRLEKVAQDIVAHFIARGYQGKAMAVSIDKPTAVKMFDKVQKYWKQQIIRLGEQLRSAPGEVERNEIEEKLKFMQETDMAVVVSQEQNEAEKFRKLGLDIMTHRKRMIKEDLAQEFKNSEDPFRIVFVCAMWMTGFDVHPLSTIYLDKPMRNHTLMQTIARANRVFEGKTNGLIVDYVGVFRNLKKALAIYGSGGAGVLEPGDMPVKPKSELIRSLQESVATTVAFCEEKGIDVELIIKAAEPLQRIKLLDKAVDLILVNDESKQKYIGLAGYAFKLYKAILPDLDAGQFSKHVTLFRVIADKIRSLAPEVDITAVMDDVEHLLDESIDVKGYIIRNPLELPGDHLVDLSKVDFEALRKRLVEDRKRAQAEKLKEALKAKTSAMLMMNRSRMNFQERLEQLIDEYNSGAINVELFFKELVDFAEALSEEEKRGIAKGLSEEELAVFDLLNKPGLTKKEEKEVKKAAKDLLQILKKEKLVLDWRKRQQTRAGVEVTIRDVLRAELPSSYTPKLFKEKCDDVYQHVFESYYGEGKSIYLEAA